MKVADLYSPAEIEEALRLVDFDGLAAQSKMSPVARAGGLPLSSLGRPRLGAVLLLLYRLEGPLYLLLTRRRDDLSAHAGQISLPGGRLEDGETPEIAALRETYEEVGVAPAAVEILGMLTPLYIPASDFEVHPFVAWHAERPAFLPDPLEVAEIIEAPLESLLDPANPVTEEWYIRGYPVQVPYFRIDGHKIWGATAMIVSEFLERLRTIRAD